jgi:multimeric flavodoxin WrbA
MKVLILNGGPRKKGATSTILNKISEGAAEKHVIDLVQVYDLKMKPCVGCLKCRPDKECVMPEDDAQIVGRKIKDADVVVVGSPTYWGNMTGPLKTLFDRNVTTIGYFNGGLPKPNHKGKRAVIVTSSASPWPFNLISSQSGGAVRSIKTVLKGGGFKIIGVINMSSSKKKPEVPEKLLRQALSLGRRVLSFF